ncbi:hypothetical protein CORT_0E01140 [Candida orthopsilosis Co 90-125]|uniref:Uncharacterized protein n=1 Tax=Candida orthopsilosis (strain 90-125) TaxID=1136231 RepID=H8X6U2_CANO9|nr:hypothetical protein CORT_0E01140 [Candida orthopsilosis Co 90-125]CCG23703.1 hypothetical protein CORT_0E01140 [Candida orthopsilosis Co 90-125]
MSDNVARQKSARWVTEVPNYGDWGDEDYDEYSDDNATENVTNTQAQINHEGLNQDDVVYEEEPILEENKTERPETINTGDHREVGAHTETKSPLVLSIDRHENRAETDSSEEEEDGETHGHTGYERNTNAEARANVLPRRTSTYEEVVPGAFRDDEKIHNASVATATIPDTPQEDENRSRNAYYRSDRSEFVVPPTPTFSEFSGHSNYPETFSEASFQSDSSIQREPVNLSVKDSNLANTSGVLLEEPNDLGERQQERASDPEKLVLSIDNRANNINDDDSTDDDWGYQGNDTSDEEDNDEHLKVETEQDIDSYINELSGHASIKNDDDSVNAPKVDISEIEPKHFDAASHDEIDSPIAPLSIAQQHNTYLNEMASRKSSVRKAPTRIESGDYSNLINGYGDEEESNIEPQSGHSRKESVEFVPPSMDVRSILSSGSLSTGKLSLESRTFQKPETNDDEELNSRRVSQATLSFGNWVPNTDNYRNKFINDNDNESTINFESDVASKYNKFTKARAASGLSDVVSNASSVSVPETIDAAMPSIQEDTDDETQNDSFGDTKSSDRLEPFVTQDSLFESKPYQKPVFGEERLTPAASKDNLPQKYSSLLPMQERKASDGSDEIATQSRTVSANSNSTTVVTSAPTTSSTTDFKPRSYPVSNWKTIVTISQPVDRIAAFKRALADEAAYETGLQYWLNYTLKQSPDSGNNIHIGRIASQAYQNATHNDLRRHGSLRSKVNVMKDKVEGTGSTASSFGKKLFSRSRKFISGDK